jgi:hypothetical protein
MLVYLAQPTAFASIGSQFKFTGHLGDFQRGSNSNLNGIVLSPDRRTVTFIVGGSLPAELIVARTSDLTPLYREPTSTIVGRSMIESLRIFGMFAFEVMHDSGHIIVDGMRGQEPGLIRLSGPPYSAGAFAGPFFIRLDGASIIGQSLYVVASRTDGGDTYLYELDPVSLAVRDSVHEPDAEQVIASADGRHFFLFGRDIKKLDSLTGDVLAAAAIPVTSQRARLFLSRTSHRVYLVDPGDYRDWPGPGRIYQWSDNLDPLPDIALPSRGLTPAVAGGVTTSANGDTLFVTTGTASAGPLFGPQPAALLILDANSHAVLKEIDLGGWLPRQILPLY